MVLPALAWGWGRTQPAWVLMWALAFSLYLGCKWLTLWEVSAEGRAMGKAMYFLAWPGMDPQAFLHKGTRGGGDWALLGLAMRNVFVGWICLWFLAPVWLDSAPLLAGWLGMTGMIFMLHFGLFHLLSFLWQRLGYGAEPLMHRPIEARSVANFWGQRWNLAFQRLTMRYLFRPLQKRFTPQVALGTSFLASGLIHELVITVPAGGGVGGPTAYFLIQGLAVLLERRMRRKRHVIWGHVWTLCVVLLPAGLLFPAVFVRNIVLPMFTAWGLFS